MWEHETFGYPFTSNTWVSQTSRLILSSLFISSFSDCSHLSIMHVFTIITSSVTHPSTFYLCSNNNQLNLVYMIHCYLGVLERFGFSNPLGNQVHKTFFSSAFASAWSLNFVWVFAHLSWIIFSLSLSLVPLFLLFKYHFPFAFS